MISIKTSDPKFNKLMINSKIEIIKTNDYSIFLNGCLALEFNETDISYILENQNILRSEKYKKDIDQYIMDGLLQPKELISLVEITLNRKTRMLSNINYYNKKKGQELSKEPPYLRRLKFVYLTLKEII